MLIANQSFLGGFGQKQTNICTYLFIIKLEVCFTVKIYPIDIVNLFKLAAKYNFLLIMKTISPFLIYVHTYTYADIGIRYRVQLRNRNCVAFTLVLYEGVRIPWVI